VAPRSRAPQQLPHHPGHLPAAATSTAYGAAMHDATVLKCGAFDGGVTKTVSFFKKKSRSFFKILFKKGQK
jgi:hypothetical protein